MQNKICCVSSLVIFFPESKAITSQLHIYKEKLKYLLTIIVNTFRRLNVRTVLGFCFATKKKNEA